MQQVSLSTAELAFLQACLDQLVQYSLPFVPTDSERTLAQSTLSVTETALATTTPNQSVNSIVVYTDDQLAFLERFLIDVEYNNQQWYVNWIGLYPQLNGEDVTQMVFAALGQAIDV